MLLFNDEEHAMLPVSWAREIERLRVIWEAEKPPMTAKVTDTINTHAPKVVLDRGFAKLYLPAQAFKFPNLAFHSGR